MMWPFGDLPLFSAGVIYADPPWPFENYSAKGESRNPNRHYHTMSLDQIQALPVGHLAAEACACFMWVTDPHLPAGIDTLKAWGFRYATVAFTWAKLNRRSEGFFMGTGYYTRANPEICLLGVTGPIGRPKSRAVRQLVVEPIREHSRKPDSIRASIEAMYPGPYLELFARAATPGWSVWGNETEKFEVMP